MHTHTRWTEQIGLSGIVLLAASQLLACQSPPGDSTAIAPSPPSPSLSPSAIATPPQKSEVVKNFEKRLRGDLIKKAGIPVQTVSCPLTVDVNTRSPFTCEATAEGQKFAIAVNPKTTTPASPTDKNELRWSTQGLLVLPKLEQTIQQGIQQQFQLAVKANCGGKIRVAKPGDTFQCRVTDDRGQTKAVSVRVDDAQGNVTWKL